MVEALRESGACDARVHDKGEVLIQLVVQVHARSG